MWKIGKIYKLKTSPFKFIVISKDKAKVLTSVSDVYKKGAIYNLKNTLDKPSEYKELNFKQYINACKPKRSNATKL